MKAAEGAFIQEKALAVALSAIVKLQTSRRFVSNSILQLLLQVQLYAGRAPQRLELAVKHGQDPAHCAY